MYIEVPKVPVQKLQVGHDTPRAESSAIIKQRVEAARVLQKQRFQGSRISQNSEMTSQEIHAFCALDSESDQILKQAVQRFQLSARSYYRILRLARSIADLEGKEHVVSAHILEALSYRKQEA